MLRDLSNLRGVASSSQCIVTFECILFNEGELSIIEVANGSKVVNGLEEMSAYQSTGRGTVLTLVKSDKRLTAFLPKGTVRLFDMIAVVFLGLIDCEWVGMS